MGRRTAPEASRGGIVGDHFVEGVGQRREPFAPARAREHTRDLRKRCSPEPCPELRFHLGPRFRAGEQVGLRDDEHPAGDAEQGEDVDVLAGLRHDALPRVDAQEHGIEPARA